MIASLDDLRILALVARERSFTRAASLLNLPQSSVSRVVRLLEEELGMPLLARTTRSVAPTTAGIRLLASIGPALERIDAELLAFANQTGRPAGTVRLTLVRHAFETVLRPILPKFLANYPDIEVEIAIQDELQDIVSERFDAGIRFGGIIEKDMIALRVGPDFRAAVVASPTYIAKRGAPDHPDELTQHNCINYRLASSAGLYRWRFQKDGLASEVRVSGNLTLNDGGALIEAALDGLGIAYTFQDNVIQDLAKGHLVSLLQDWCPTFPGYQIYYPSRRQISTPLRLLVDALRDDQPVAG